MTDLDESADGTTIHLVAGAVLRLALPENPTTGYRWRIIADGAPVLRPQADDFAPGRAVPGAGGTRHWAWQAAQPGEATLRLDYARPWETGPAARHFAVTIRVGP
jgi:inhibitor of cysteine peptidase